MTKTERLELWKHELDLNNWKYEILDNDIIAHINYNGTFTFITALPAVTDITVRNIGYINEDQYDRMMFAINRFNEDHLSHNYFIDDKNYLGLKSLCFDENISFDWLVQVINGLYGSPEVIVKLMADNFTTN